MFINDLKLTIKSLQTQFLVLIVVAVIYFLFTSVLFPEISDFLTDLHIGEIYYYFLVPALILVFLSGILFIRIIQIREINLSILLLGILCFGLSYYFGFLNWDPQATSTPITQNYSIQLLFSNISTLLLIIHFELLEKSKFDSKYLTIFLFLLSPLMIMNIYEVFTKDFLSDTIRSYLVILTQIGTFLIMVRLLQHSSSIFARLKRFEKSTRIVGIIFLGVCALGIHVIFEIIDEFISVQNTPWLVIAIVILTVAFVLGPYEVIMEPSNIIAYAIINKGGIPYYFKKVDPTFKIDQSSENESMLLAGLINALTTLSKDVINAKAIESIEFGDRTIVINFHEMFFFVGLVSQLNFFVDRSFRRYSVLVNKTIYREFPDVYSKLKNGHAVLLNDAIRQMFQKLDKKVFPYIE